MENNYVKNYLVLVFLIVLALLRPSVRPFVDKQHNRCNFVSEKLKLFKLWD